MILLPHYLKVAVRNLRRYPVQALISIVGLAAGFVCLSLSALWNQYESTYNADIPNVDRMYMLYNPDMKNFLSPGLFMEKACQMPEVEAFATFEVEQKAFFLGEKEADAEVLQVDQHFFELFDIRCTNGSLLDKSLGSSLNIALSRSLYEYFYGEEEPVGQVLHYNNGAGFSIPFNVTAVFEDMDPHTDIRADAIMLYECGYTQNSWQQAIFRLQPGETPYTSFCRKADEHVEWKDTTHLRAVPMTKVHGEGFGNHGSLSRTHQRTFLIISLMLTICALVNFITFCLNRLQARRREMALRLVHGATGRGLIALFSTESLLILLSSVVLGMLGIVVLEDAFAQFADIQAKGYIFGHSFLFMALTLIICLLVCTVAVAIVQHSSIQHSIHTIHQSRHTFANVSTALQLIISLTFIFCTLVMFRQVNEWRTRDWGVAYKNVGIYSLGGYRECSKDGVFILGGSVLHSLLEERGILSQFQTMRGITDLLQEGAHFIDRWSSENIFDIRRTPDSTPIEACYRHGIFEPSSPLYGFTVLEGSLPTAENWQDNEIIITESMRDQLGLTQAIGQTIELHYPHLQWTSYTIVCVIRDITYGEIHSKKGEPYIFLNPDEDARKNNQSGDLIFSFEPGQREVVARQIREMMEANPDLMYAVRWGEDVMEDAIESETNLIHLLTCITVVAILIALFGIYSIITLACRQRRKEIAIRKVHGAKRHNIITLFVREYGLILLISATFAFLAGTLIMNRWLESYVYRVTIPWWLYIALFLATALLIALCVGSRLLRTTRENPAEVVKSE